MVLKPQTTWLKEVIVWGLCLATALVLGSILIFRGVLVGVGARARLQEEQHFWPALSQFSEASNRTSGLGRAYLDLDLLAQAYSLDEADNVRWSLVRRTPAAAEVYDRERGIDWLTLRQQTQAGTILIPAGFQWSFNETFRQGPGYKEAGGILAGGHCALASAFRAAAIRARLPAESRPHARPIPGFSPEEAVNIYWGRDDLVIHNTREEDLFFAWVLTPVGIEITVAPVSAAHPLPHLPDWRDATIAVVYGRPGPGGWGSLGQATTADYALHLARTYATRVDEWNGSKPVTIAVNPNAVMVGHMPGQDLYLQYLIAEARRQGYYVMLDVQPGEMDPLTLFEGLMDRYLQENVWFDWDIEHTAGGKVEAGQINAVAAAYFERRQAMGYQSPGILGFYVFSESQIVDPSAVRRQYAGGIVVPIFDGFGGHGPDPAGDKIARTARVLSLFDQGPYGIMEFETRWGDRFDQISARQYFEAFPDALFMISQ